MSTWTHTRPSSFGFYWCRAPRGDGAFKKAFIVQIVKKHGTSELAAMFAGGIRELSCCDIGFQWSNCAIKSPNEEAAA